MIKLRTLHKNLHEASYTDFRDDDSISNKKKINTSISEINKKLREVEVMITHASRLKGETNSDQSIFWTTTTSKFQRIGERLLKVASKIREINT